MEIVRSLITRSAIFKRKEMLLDYLSALKQALILNRMPQKLSIKSNQNALYKP